MKTIIDPINIFEQNSSKGGVCEIKQKWDRSAATASYTLVAAVAGKRIRVISFYVGNATAGGLAMLFRSGATGVIYGSINLAAGANYFLANNECGWFETVTGDALLYDSSAAGVDVQVRYIEIVP